MLDYQGNSLTDYTIGRVAIPLTVNMNSPVSSNRLLNNTSISASSDASGSYGSYFQISLIKNKNSGQDNLSPGFVATWERYSSVNTDYFELNPTPTNSADIDTDTIYVDVQLYLTYPIRNGNATELSPIQRTSPYQLPVSPITVALPMKEQLLNDTGEVTHTYNYLHYINPARGQFLYTLPKEVEIILPQPHYDENTIIRPQPFLPYKPYAMTTNKNYSYSELLQYQQLYANPITLLNPYRYIYHSLYTTVPVSTDDCDTVTIPTIPSTSGSVTLTVVVQASQYEVDTEDVTKFAQRIISQCSSQCLININ